MYTDSQVQGRSVRHAQRELSAYKSVWVRREQRAVTFVIILTTRGKRH